jgi:hypothetical protein
VVLTELIPVPTLKPWMSPSLIPGFPLRIELATTVKLLMPLPA